MAPSRQQRAYEAARRIADQSREELPRSVSPASVTDSYYSDVDVATASEEKSHDRADNRRQVRTLSVVGLGLDKMFAQHGMCPYIPSPTLSPD